MLTVANTDPFAISIGQPWSVSFQASLNAGFYIQSASNATPISIVTTHPHGYSSGNKVFIGGCIANNAANNTDSNPSWTITVVDSVTFTLNTSVGTGAGGQEGAVTKISDLTGYSGSCQLRESSDARIGALILSPAFAWVSIANGRFNISLTQAQTLTAGLPQTLYGEVDINNGTTVSIAKFTSAIIPQTDTSFD